MLLYCTICGMVCDHIIRDHTKNTSGPVEEWGGSSFKKRKLYYLEIQSQSQQLRNATRDYFPSQTLEENILGPISA